LSLSVQHSHLLLATAAAHGVRPPEGRILMIITRRGLLEAVGGALAGGSFLPALAGGEAEQSDALWLSPLLPQGTRAEAALDTLPGKSR
jgi:hypothetical protein